MQLLVLLTLLILTNTANSCASAQYTDKNGNCQTCPKNCLTCTSSTSCNTCVSNTYVFSNAAGSLCQPCSSVLQGCITCVSNLACQICDIRFINQNGTCKSCSTLIPNCSNCSADGNTCNQCKYPYILKGNSCVSGTTEQIIAGGNLSPVAPLPNTNPIRNETLPNGTIVTVVIDSNGCNQYQIYVWRKCFKIIPNCQVYQPSGFCQICNANYLVTIFGDCINNNTKLKCENGFWLDKANDVCVKVSVACDWYYPNNGSCFNCSKNYMMSNGNCIAKLNCTSRQFYSSEGKCVDINILCASFTEDGTCTGCYSNYYLQDGACITVTPVVKVNICAFPCETCFNQNLDYCFSCAFGFQLRNARYGACIPIRYWCSDRLHLS